MTLLGYLVFGIPLVIVVVTLTWIEVNYHRCMRRLEDMDDDVTLP